jgi:predicted phage tail protein
VVISTHVREDKAEECAANKSLADGKAYKAIGKYEIEVVATQVTQAPQATGSAALSWTTPTKNTDGTAIRTPISYRVEYGKGGFSQSLTTTANSLTVTGLASGSYLFRVVAITPDGESQPSAVGDKVIP